MDGEVTVEGDGNDYQVFQEMIDSVGGFSAENLSFSYNELMQQGYDIRQIIRADMNKTGTIDIQDFVLFVTTFVN